MTALEALLVLPLLHYKAVAVRRALPVPLWLPAACIESIFAVIRTSAIGPRCWVHHLSTAVEMARLEQEVGRPM